MANLKDINYGIGKYLEASDASAIPDITTNRTNIDLLNFKVATNNAYSLYNFKDGMIDGYQDETGVDTSGSTNDSYDSTNKVYSPAITASTLTAFTTVGVATWTCPAGITSAEILVVGSGGSGEAGPKGGGGGAGGVVHATSYTVVPAVVYDLEVAQKRDGVTNPGGNRPGYSSNFNTNAEGGGTIITAIGGGGAGAVGRYNASDGGSGGGGGSSGGDGTQADSGGGTGYGNDGADSTGSYGGGGGGAGAVGGVSDTRNGGIGKLFSTFVAYGTDSAGTPSTGSNGGWFAGGGFGGTTPGGNETYPTSWPATPGGATYGGSGNHAGGYGHPNTGAGGGGGGDSVNQGGGNSATGFVGVYTSALTNNMTLLSNAQTAQADPTEGRLVLYEQDVDSITLDTDLKGYVSRDGGTTYTQTPLAEDGFLNVVRGNDGYTKLLLHCDGANDGTTFTDSSGSAHSVTVTNAVTKTAIKKFGTASGYFDGTGDKLVIPSSSDFGFGTGDWTMDWWFYLDDTGSDPHIFDNRNSGIQTLFFDTSDSYKMVYYVSQSPSGDKIVSSSAPTPDTWIHFALVRSSGTTTMYFDGTSVGSFSDSFDYPACGLTIGDYVGGSFEYTGYMDEIRISKGIARWTSNFTPDTSPYDTNTRLLSGSVDISGQPSGTSMKYKVETLNNKKLKLHGASLLWA